MEQTEMEQISFRALVSWHKEDLLEIMNGASALTVLNGNKRKRLKEYGILVRSRHSEKVRLTPEAIAVMEDQDSLLTETQE